MVLKVTFTKSKMKKVLFIRTNALGDVFLTLPVINAFIKTHSETEAFVLTDPSYTELFHALLPKKNIFSTGFPFYPEKVFEQLNRISFDRVINLQDHFRGAWYAGNIRATGKAGVFINEEGVLEATPESLLMLDCRESRFLREKVHIMDVFSMISGVDVLKIPGYIPMKTGKSFPKNKRGKKTISLHLSCGWPSRSLNKEKILDLVSSLSSSFSSHSLLLLGNGKEEESTYSGLKFPGNNIRNLVNKMSLPETLNTLKNSSLFIGIDSSLMHFAFSYKIPTITLWCSTTPEGMGNRWKTEKDREIVSKSLCHPCFSKDCRNGLCFKKLKIQDVVSAANKVLK